MNTIQFEKKYTVGIGAIALLLYLLPALTRFLNNNWSFPDNYSYYFAMQFPTIPLHVLYLSSLVGGIIIAVLLWKMLQPFFTQSQRILMIGFFLFSPGFVYLGNTFVRPLVYILWLLVGFSLLHQKKQFIHIAGLFVLCTTLFIGYEGIITALLLLFYNTIIKKSKYYLVVCSLLMLVAALFFPNPVVFPVTENMFAHGVVEFGSTQGILLGHIFLALVGLLVMWRQKYTFFSLFLLIIVLLLGANHFHFFIVYLGILLCLISGFVFEAMLRRQWEYPSIKYISISALLGLLLLSHVTFVHTLSTGDPQPAYIDALKELESYKQGNVFTHPSRAYIVEYYSGKHAVFYPHQYSATVEQLYQSQLFRTTVQLLKKFDVSYIIVEEPQDNTTTHRQEGLHYLLTDTTRFTEIFSNNAAQIYIVQEQYQS